VQPTAAAESQVFYCVQLGQSRRYPDPAFTFDSIWQSLPWSADALSICMSFDTVHAEGMAEPLSPVEKQLRHIGNPSSASRASSVGSPACGMTADRPRATTLCWQRSRKASLLRRERLTRLTAPVAYWSYLLLDNRIRKPQVIECVDHAEVVYRIHDQKPSRGEVATRTSPPLAR
jgi:hypothetical protein